MLQFRVVRVIGMEGRRVEVGDRVGVGVEVIVEVGGRRSDDVSSVTDALGTLGGSIPDTFTFKFKFTFTFEFRLLVGTVKYAAVLSRHKAR